MNWEILAHEADVGVRGCGAATAMTAPDAEMLLVNWLNALVYEMATRRMLFSRFDVSIELGTSGMRLQASAWGEAVDVAKHQPAAEVKGASFCALAVRREADGGWLAQCVVDV